jgi:hypothetical protein
MKTRKILKNNLTVYFAYLLFKKGWYNLLYSDRDFFLKQYKKTYGVYPDLDNPKTFYEKLIWSMLYHRNELYIKCSDKYEAREYVRLKVGEEYLIKNYGIYNKLEEVKFSELPSSFVLKATHASGWNLICCNKSKLNIQKASKLLNFWFSHNYYEFDREWPYNFMPKRVICEEFIGSDSCKAPNDYKIFCFSGEPKIIELHIDRFTDHKCYIFDIEWNLIEEAQSYLMPALSKDFQKPKNLEQMLEVAGKLSKDFEHVRIDLYNLDGKIYFGEMTFFCGGGVDYFSSKEFHELVGSWFNLPKANISIRRMEHVIE